METFEESLKDSLDARVLKMVAPLWSKKKYLQLKEHGGTRFLTIAMLSLVTISSLQEHMQGHLERVCLVVSQKHIRYME